MILPYPQELDDPKYRDDPQTIAIKDLYNLINVQGLDDANLAMRSVGPQQMKNPYRFKAYRSTDQTGLTDVAYTTIVFDAETYDTNSNYDTSTGIWTAPVTGYYYIGASVYSGVTGVAVTAIYKNGTVTRVLLGDYVPAGGTSQICSTCSSVLYLSSGDTLRVRLYWDGTGTGTATAGEDITWFTAHLLSL